MQTKSQFMISWSSLSHAQAKMYNVATLSLDTILDTIIW